MDHATLTPASNARAGFIFMRIILAVSLCAVLAACASPRGESCRPPAHHMNRVELFFGAAFNDGKPIGNAEWQVFLDKEVTPRFPAGLTAYEAYGQWQRPDGRIEKSPSRVLVIWYEGDQSSRIDAIREAYKKRFRQMSVMRVDSADCVSF
jgi:hypothetical protein